jgi:hypothetical protein
MGRRERHDAAIESGMRSFLLTLLLALWSFTAATAMTPADRPARGYHQRNCGFDLNFNGTPGEAGDCKACDGTIGTGVQTTEDVDGNGTNDQQIYVNCDSGANTASCGGPSDPCRTITYAFANRTVSPSPNQIQAVCFTGTCTAEASPVNFPQSGATGSFTIGPRGDEPRSFQYPRYPFILSGWDTDNDDRYPPADGTAVIDGTDTKVLAFQNYAINMDRLEFAHFAVTNYGNVSTQDGGFMRVGDADHLYLHDLELSDININRAFNYPPGCGGDEPKVIDFFSWNGGSWTAFENMKCIRCGGFHFRGALPPNGHHGFKLKNWQSLDYTQVSQSGCKGVMGFKIWGGGGPYTNLQILDSIFDHNISNWSPDLNGFNYALTIPQCDQEVDIINNEFHDYFKGIVLQPHADGFECGAPLTNLNIDGNLFAFAQPISGINQQPIWLQGCGTSSEYVDNVTIKNNVVLTNGTGVRAGILVADMRTSGGAPPGYVHIYNNTFVGNTNSSAYGMIAFDSTSCTGTWRTDYTVKGNIFAGVTSANAGQCVLTTSTPSGLVMDGNDYDPDCTFRFNNGSELTSLAAWQSALGGCPGTGNECSSVECNPTFVSGDDYHLQASDTCAKDAGMDTGILEDYDGQNRPFNIVYDIGADEYVNGTTSTTTPTSTTAPTSTAGPTTTSTTTSTSLTTTTASTTTSTSLTTVTTILGTWPQRDDFNRAGPGLGSSWQDRIGMYGTSSSGRIEESDVFDNTMDGAETIVDFEREGYIGEPSYACILIGGTSGSPGAAEVRMTSVSGTVECSVVAGGWIAGETTALGAYTHHDSGTDASLVPGTYLALLRTDATTYQCYKSTDGTSWTALGSPLTTSILDATNTYPGIGIYHQDTFTIDAWEAGTGNTLPDSIPCGNETPDTTTTTSTTTTVPTNTTTSPTTTSMSIVTTTTTTETTGTTTTSTGATATTMTSTTTSTVPEADLAFDPTVFISQYEVSGVRGPAYAILPATSGPSPFNSEATPALLPCQFQNLDIRLQVAVTPNSARPYGELTVRLYGTDGMVISSRGFDNASSVFDRVDVALPLLDPGTWDVPFTPISSVDPSRNELFQPRDLPKNRPVRLEMFVAPYADAALTRPLTDPTPADDVLNLWVMRTC